MAISLVELHALEQAHLLRLFEDYCANSNRGVFRASTLAVNDGKFYSRIAHGGSCTLRTYNRVVQWFSDNWPADLAWPSDITRPAPLKGSPAAEAEAANPLTALDARGQIADPNALCATLQVRRYVYDGVIRHYADGRDRQERKPRRHCDSRRVFDALVAAGDVRFNSRKATQNFLKGFGLDIFSHT